MTIVFVYQKIIVGGAELVIQHLGQALVEQGHEVQVLCASVDPVMRASFEQAGLEVHVTEKWPQAAQLVPAQACVVTMFWRDYLQFYAQCGPTVKTILYSVIEWAFIEPFWHKRLCETREMADSVKQYIAKAIKERRFVALNEEVYTYTRNVLGSGWPIAEEDYSILRIAMDMSQLVPLDLDLAQKKLARPVIMSVARTDFPFKGYLLGLVRWFQQYADDKLELLLVTYGPDIGELNALLAQLSPEQRARVHVYGKTPHEELKKYYARALLYVGMGTTILDSAMNGVPAVPVNSMTRELEVSGFFTDNFRNLGGPPHGAPFQELVQQVRSLSPEAYLTLAQKGQQLLTEHYGSQAGARKLVEVFQHLGMDRQPPQALAELQRLYDPEQRIKQHVMQILAQMPTDSRIALYPYGWYGEVAAKIIQEQDPDRQLVRVDNGPRAQQAGAIPLSQLWELEQDYYLILTADRDDIFNEIAAPLKGRLAPDHLFLLHAVYADCMRELGIPFRL